MPAEDKEQYIERLFAGIAHRYDLLNSLLSLNLDKSWRRFAVRQCALSAGDSAIDVATGTGDLAIELAGIVGSDGHVAAVDFCRPMLDLCARKLAKRGIENVTVVQANAEDVPFPANSFRAATIGFAMRNVSSAERTLAEMMRVVEPGGRVVCLEFACPGSTLFGRAFNLYFHRVLPFIGGILSGSRESYAYLPRSVEAFHSREELSRIMANVGLGYIEVYDLTGGIVAVHVGVKK